MRGSADWLKRGEKKDFHRRVAESAEKMGRRAVLKGEIVPRWGAAVLRPY
jgi:hypothetical protein